MDLDVCVLDLEDGVAFNKKQDARKQVAGALKTLSFGRAEKAVRINAVRSGLEMCVSKSPKLTLTAFEWFLQALKFGY